MEEVGFLLLCTLHIMWERVDARLFLSLLFLLFFFMLMKMLKDKTYFIYFVFFHFQVDQTAIKGKAKNGEKFYSFHTYLNV
jgi:cytochrome c oxidase subunit IV